MFRDPIVEAIREQRQAYAARFNRDIDAICEDLRQKEQASERATVTHEPGGSKSNGKDAPAA